MQDLKPYAPDASLQVQTADEARQVMAHFARIMGALLQFLEEETAIVRAGRIGEVKQLEGTKSELARLYLAHAASVRANCAYMARELPEEFDALRH